MKRISVIGILFLLLSSCDSEKAQLSVHGLFSDNMVIQRDSELLISGWSGSRCRIEVEATWGVEGNTHGPKNGNWEIRIATPPAGGPYELNIVSSDTIIKIKNILSGEVWVASGQSNMTMPLKGWGDTVNNADQEIQNADFPNIRMLSVDRIPSFTPLNNLDAQWIVASPGKIQSFSAASWFFAKKLYSELGIPIGIIHSSWGGTPAESWTPKESLEKLESFNMIAEKLSEAEDLFPSYQKWSETATITDLNTLKSKGNPFHFLEMKFSEYIIPDFQDSAWAEMNVPQYWESQEPGDFDGIIWYRKTFFLDEVDSGTEAQLFLGVVDDMDETYLNGHKLGSHLGEGYYNFKRKYTIPKGILKAGKNVLSIRVIDSRGKGGIAGEEVVKITQSDKDLIKLSGSWKCKTVASISTSNVYWIDDQNPMPKMPVSLSSHTPSLLYNGMISPLTSFPVSGFIWYQGESNVGRAESYSTLFPELIEAWRKAWGRNDLPFYFVQIAPWDYGREMGFGSSELREAQRQTLALSNTGMVVTMDIADTSTIHPGNKQDVGERLALWALKQTYNKAEITECSGPLFEDAVQEGAELFISFTHTSGGLVLKDKNTDNFELAGTDSLFFPATAMLVDDFIVLSSDQVSQPIAARYLWSDFKTPHLFNGSGLPAPPFQAFVPANN